MKESTMTRHSRKHSETGVYHIMLRGINRQDIFEDEEDYITFIGKLKTLTEPVNDMGESIPPYCAIYAYCLMTNHVHLLLRQLTEPVSKSIQRLGVSYSRHYNKKYGHTGHLFQDRFKSEPVVDITYFIKLLQYIHQNPVAAGISDKVQDYKWSSWHEYEDSKHHDLCDIRPVIDRIPLDELRELVCNPVEGYILDDEEEYWIYKKDREIKDAICRRLNIKSLAEIQNMNKEMRNIILVEALEQGAGIRQLARLTGISYGIIYRLKQQNH